MLLKSFVIGSTVEAACYALVSGCFFIPTRKAPSLFYHKTSIPLFGLDSDEQVWTKINLILGLLSRRVSFQETSSIRITDDMIRVTTGNTVFKYAFEKLFVFNASGIELENDIRLAKDKTFIVYDDFELSILGPRRYELPALVENRDFAKSLHFYCSGRVDGSDFITDCVVESELTQEQLNLFDYSDSIVRFVVERHLKSIGVQGRFMKNYESGKPKYRKPKVVHVRRLSYQKDNNVYVDTENIKFLNKSLGEIIEESSKG
ncbi:MAG: hypothetical protein CBD51_003010 [Flavobacteriales bacterium TMED191]|nr:MAG: hypothetical protein CBD51_003010 [Flavobacteriales bacterium TMED191]|tara:strand:- start:1554 stop:2336 length:783 start_codon:yes stop_codon:yes gene_type:complete